MKLRGIVVLGIAVLLVAPLAVAKDQVSKDLKVMDLNLGSSRSNGTFGNFAVSGGQTGPLQVGVNVSATTAGDGNNTVLNFVFLAGQVYNGLWTTATWTSYATSRFPNSTPNQNFAASFSFTVPSVGDYAIWGRGFPGIYSGTTTGGVYYCPSGYICRTQDAQTCCYPASTGDLFYVNNVQPPTPTPNPNAGEPIPTIGSLGMISMVLLLAGVAILVLVRRS